MLLFALAVAAPQPRKWLPLLPRRAVCPGPPPHTPPAPCMQWTLVAALAALALVGVTQAAVKIDEGERRHRRRCREREGSAAQPCSAAAGAEPGAAILCLAAAARFSCMRSWGRCRAPTHTLPLPCRRPKCPSLPPTAVDFPVGVEDLKPYVDERDEHRFYYQAGRGRRARGLAGGLARAARGSTAPLSPALRRSPTRPAPSWCLCTAVWGRATTTGRSRRPALSAAACRSR